MNKFTSRPWKWVNKPFDKPFESRIPYITIRAGKGCFNQYDEKSGFEINGILSEADARLITAAPTMYEVLKNIINLPDNIACPSVKNFAKEAIKEVI